MAARQGSMDRLCGVYAVINATEVVIGRAQFRRNIDGKNSYQRILFSTLIRNLARNNILKSAVIFGIEELNDQGGLLDNAIRSVKRHLELKITKKPAFDSDEYALDEYWDKLIQHFSEPNTAAVINVTGRIEHWTCIKEITADRLILADSVGIKQLSRSRCVIRGNTGGLYELWPTATYLLSLNQNTNKNPKRQKLSSKSLY